jgi:2-oxoglutarate ferredoxin oxidoreductase subunit gamma
MPKTELRICGLGGQGVIMAGMIVGKAASIYDEKHAAMIQSFGPEARGSACSAQVTIDDAGIGYPYVGKLDVLVAMSQEAFDLFAPALKPDGTLVYESDLVQPLGLPESVRAYGIPATRFAEQMRRKMVTNIIMVGFLTAVTEICSQQAMQKAVEASVPRGTERLNLAAFYRGYSHGLEESGRSSEAP